MASHVYRVLIDARPTHSGGSSGQPEQGVVSVALPATDAASAQAEALTLLSLIGWTALTGVMRTSDLTQLLHGSRADAFDSAYGDYALQWLQIEHDEAQTEGVTFHLLSVDYQSLEQPKRLFP